jgi:serine/threonine protein phosphatase PrpC
MLDSPSRSAGAIDRGVIYAVSDGVSTTARGQWASQHTVSRLAQFFDQSTTATKDALVQIIGEVDWELRGEEKGQAACTLAAVWILDNELHLFQVGDSHVFRVRDDEIHCLTRDGGKGRKLNDYLGMGPAVTEVMRTKAGPVHTGDAFVLLTDGVLDAIGEAEIAATWASAKADPATCAEAIIAAVTRAKVGDDATVLVVLIL